MPKPIKLVLGVAVAAVVVIGGAVAFWATRDSAEDRASLDAIDVPGSTEPGGATRTSADGTWTIQASDAVFVGYRIHEKLQGLDKEVTGRTSAVQGSMTISGRSITAARFTADLTGLKTDNPIRDNAIRSRGIETEKFPEATFELTGPLELPSEPQPGQSVSVNAPGNLTVHGVTRPVEIALEARWEGDVIRVATAAEGLRVQFQDYGFGAISVPSAQTDDFAFLEVQLVFVPA